MNNILFREENLFDDISLPPKNENHIWLFSIKKYPILTEDIENLPDYEKKRAEDFRLEEDRLRYTLSRALLRRLLSNYLNSLPSSFVFEKGEHGKPYLKDSPLYFNLSHSNDYIALVFSTNSPVGIDVEKVRPEIRKESLVRHFFHPDEATEFSSLSEDAKEEFLFRRWTIREAFLKGLGTGLTLSPNSFYVASFSGSTEEYRIETRNSSCDKTKKDAKKSQEDYSSWRIACVPAPEQYYCSVAFQVE